MQAFTLGLIATLAACGGGGGGGSGFFPIMPVAPVAPVTPPPESPPVIYTVGGTVSGLLGSGLVLQNNGGDDLPIAADGTFSFPTQIAKGATYAVTVKIQPKILTRECTVSAGSGTIADVAVANVAVKCAPPPARFAYVPSTAQTLSGYTIDPTLGTLTAMAGPALPTGGFPIFTATHPSGRFAYVLNVIDSTISGYTIDTASGALSAMPGPAMPTAATPVGIAVEPTGRFAYVVTAAGISTFTIDQSTGSLSATGTPFTLTLPPGPQLLSIDPTGRFVYAIGVDTNQILSVLSFTINQTTGDLTASGVPVAVGSTTLGIAVDPTGRFAYVPDPTTSTIAMFSINATTGALTALSTPTVNTTNPISFLALDPSGRFAYAPDFVDGKVLTYAVDAASGALSAAPVSSLVAGTNPQYIAVDPAGRFVYIQDTTGANVLGFKIDATSGALSPLTVPSTALPPGATLLVLSR